MCNLIGHVANYSKTSECLCQYYREEPALADAGAFNNFPSNSTSFKFKQKITHSTENNGTKNVKIMAH